MTNTPHPPERCWICAKEKGQPPERCNGHYSMSEPSTRTPEQVLAEEEKEGRNESQKS